VKDYADYLSEYKHLRDASRELNHRIVRSLQRDELLEGAKKLGMLKNGVLVFESDDQTSLLMDYCLYNVLRGGQTVVERFMAASPPLPGSDESRILEANRKAWYSVFEITSTEFAVGVGLRDLLKQQDFFMMDTNFGRSARAGYLLATRVMPYGDYLTSGGAALPMANKPTLDKVVKKLHKKLPDQKIRLEKLTRRQEAEFSAYMIAECRRASQESQIKYQDAR